MIKRLRKQVASAAILAMVTKRRLLINWVDPEPLTRFLLPTGGERVCARESESARARRGAARTHARTQTQTHARALTDTHTHARPHTPTQTHTAGGLAALSVGAPCWMREMLDGRG